jgi:hypothetical protein
MHKLYSIILLSFIAGNCWSHFIENLGQIKQVDGTVNTEVLFSFNSNGIRITLRENGFSYELMQPLFNEETIMEAIHSKRNSQFPFEINRIDFITASAPNQIIKKKAVKGRKNFLSHNGQMITPDSYEEILYIYEDLGAMIHFKSITEGFKYDLIFTSETAFNEFYFQVDGADIQGINERGNFQYLLGGESILEEKIPYSWYRDVSGKKSETSIQYSYNSELSRLYFSGNFESNFDLLVIDPQPEMLWSTYFGGSEYDIVTRVAVDSSNHVYHTGITMSTDNIATSGAFQQTYMGDLDVFVARYHPSGALHWSTYFGGPQTERAYGIATTSDNHVIVGGTSFSEFGIATIGSYQETIAGTDDAFLVKFDQDGNRVWGTYYGGNAHDFVTSINIDGAGKIFITGHTRSVNNISTSGTFLETMTATEAAYLSCFSPQGFLEWGTYIGTEGSTSGESIAFDGDFVYVGGRSNSPNGISTPNSHQPAKQGGTGFHDAFLSKFNNDGTIVWSTYYGGDFGDRAYGVIVDDDGFVYLNGDASSLNNIATPGSYMPSRISSESGFLAKFSPSGVRQWGTYLGGYSANYIKVITYLNGEIINGGNTNSLTNIATAGAYQQQHSGDYDGFLMAIDTAGALKWGTYFGGPLNDQLSGLVVDQHNNIIISGHTGSTSGIANEPSQQPDFAGGIFDGWVGKLCYAISPTLTFDNNTLTSSVADTYTWYLNGEEIADTAQSIVLSEDGDYYVITSSNQSCPMTSEVYSHSTVNIDEQSQLLTIGVNIYPNPASDQLYVSSEEVIIGYRIYDTKGSIVDQNQNFLSQNAEIDLSRIHTGTYIIQFEMLNNSVKKYVFVIL